MYYITPIYGDAKLCKVFDIEPVVRTTLKESNETKDFQRQKKNVETKFLKLLKDYKNNETPELKKKLESVSKDKERIEKAIEKSYTKLIAFELPSRYSETLMNGTEVNKSHGNYLFLPKHIAMQLTGLLYDYRGGRRKINEVKKK